MRPPATTHTLPNTPHERQVQVDEVLENTITAVYPDPDAKPASPVTPAIVWNDLVFSSGQVPRNPNGDISAITAADQTRVVLANLKRVLEAAGTSMEKVVKTTVYLTSIGDMAEMNKVYRESFPGNLPARTTVEVSALGNSAYSVEIEAIAIR